MGCWTETCGLSGLPITEGDKVKLVFLLPRYRSMTIEGLSSYCGSTSVLTPCLLPITGEYDDYGGVQNIVEDWNTDIVFKSLKDYLGDKILIEGIEHNDYTLTDVIDGITQGNMKYFKLNKVESEYYRLYHREDKLVNIPDGEQRDSKLAFFMILEDVWNNVVNYGSESYMESSILSFIINFTNRLNVITDANMSDNANKFMLENLSDLFYIHFRELKLIDNGLYFNKLIENESERSDNGEFYKAYKELDIIITFFFRIRKGIMVSFGGGSQEGDYEAVKFLSENIIKICDEKIASFDIND